MSNNKWREMICRLLGHEWQDTAINAYMIPIEQRCARCEAYRHHRLKDVNGEVISWREGRNDQ